jgi:hypothetical protein
MNHLANSPDRIVTEDDGSIDVNFEADVQTTIIPAKQLRAQLRKIRWQQLLERVKPYATVYLPLIAVVSAIATAPVGVSLVGALGFLALMVAVQ